MKTDTPQNPTTNTPEHHTTKFIKRLKVVVTQKDIDDAKQAKSDGCMIQQALKRDYGFQNIWVDKHQIRCTDSQKNCIYTFEMHPRGRVMILKWDAGEEVKPFDLYLRNPVVRERVLIKGVRRPKTSEQHAASHLGPIPKQKTKKQRAASGKDRIFGRKLWSDELAQVRADLSISSSE